MSSPVVFHTRAQVALGSPVLARLALRTPDEQGAHKWGLTWHHSGADGSLFKPDPFERLRGIWDYHVHTLGYGDIAYAGAFDGDGRAFGLRDGRYVGAHAGSTGNVANVLTDGIVFLEDSRGFTNAAAAAFEWWSNLFRWVQHRPPVHFAHEWWSKGHGGQPTACPGDDVARVVRFCGGNT